MSDRLTALRVFERVARRGSFSAAARELGLSQPSASRIVAELERGLGSNLLVRSTRGLRLSEAGSDYLARIEPILLALDEADHAASGTGELRGRLRVALSSSFGVREVIPRLPVFLAAHPALRIDLLVSDTRQDLVAEGVNVALRLGGLPADSSLLARRIAQAPRVLVASPGYLARAGTPGSPDDLVDHDVVVGPAASGRELRFRRGNRTRAVRVEARMTVGANEAATAAAVAGLGLTVNSSWGCRAELESGALVAVLPEWTLPPVDFHAVFPPRRVAVLPAARKFVDYLAESFRDHLVPPAAVARRRKPVGT
ncbi:MAG: LysR family transcriptional regulator [Panacagrimonas sp.]|nr:LysR family transcriptional regulator [Panacagrimonas sp.]MCC2656386.1 LysR family transcriptional regulator [Panacagrimonas sp.]